MHMIRDIGSRLRGRRATLGSAVELLGPPDGQRSLGSPRWELRVNCGGFMYWDLFVYWPTEAYPDHMYSGSVERIGGWAYVHE